ncbi:magnesium chelatase [Salinisphaera orenii MK-B5]|uniref:Magnesium chelatase n=1 Tax=Salinisphaera orenii MK-B5 TaxID=856730 RepID=A0A423PKR2_9GAMM|nr:ATP-binding protein [Salinisphaera orenii]ROO26186.1 magnesium chelatase [Salinisphaera orenii MK-B5]
MPRADFPFAAVVGQERLKTALLLAAIEPGLAGVLISGPRGSAKSTLARALAAIDRRADGRFVTLPLGATEEQVVGTLDLERALGTGEVAHQPGVIGRAHGGYLYIDEVNLLADALVDVLLDVAASGVNRIERDGISHEHAAEFVLMGTMNPDEGDLRPQFADRFGLCVVLDTDYDAETRRRIVDQRLAYTRDPEDFAAEHAPAQAALAERLEAARARLPQIDCNDEIKNAIAERCLAAGVEGVRADIHWRQAAVAHAAWQAREHVTAEDVEAVAEFVLCHRRNVDDSEGSGGAAGGQGGAEGSSERADSGQGDTWGGLPPRRIAPQRAVTTDPAALPNADPVGRAAQTAVAGRGAGPGRDPRGGASLAGPAGRRVDWFRTLGDAARTAHRRPRRLVHRPASTRPATLNCILLDTSASTLGQAAQDEARSAVAGIARHAWRARERLAILAFGGDRIDWLIAPKRAPKQCERALADWPAGGGTPLRAALRIAEERLRRLVRREPGLRTRTLLFTDGRCRDDIPELCWPGALAVVDTERARVPLGRARRLANRLGGGYIASPRALAVSS